MAITPKMWKECRQRTGKDTLGLAGLRSQRYGRTDALPACPAGMHQRHGQRKSRGRTPEWRIRQG
ncbi:hypothetical protein ACTJK4_21595 [Ralstonia sp. 22111]|uniref:hypothetical protein n=1 Tax=Ralstonia sp. 22111 TaxID=3453878 RepID=UPI003F878DBB